MGFRRLQRSLIGRIAAGGRAGALVGASTFGTLGTAAQLLFAPGWAVFAPLVCLSLAVATTAAWLKGKRTNIAFSFNGSSDDTHYRCRPCSRDNLRLAVSLVEPIFGRDNVSSEVIEQWRLRNPQGFMEVVNEKNELVACFVVIGLRDSFMQELVAGQVTEHDIYGETVLNMRDTKKLESIYISGVMVKDHQTHIGHMRAKCLLWCMLLYVKHHFRTQKRRKFYAIPLTKESEQLIKNLGFQLCSGASSRKDRHGCYELTMTDESWREIFRKVGECKGICHIKYDLGNA